MEKILILSLIAMSLALVYVAIENAMLRVQLKTQQNTLIALQGRLPPGYSPEATSGKLSFVGGGLWFIFMLGGVALLTWLLFRTF